MELTRRDGTQEPIQREGTREKDANRAGKQDRCLGMATCDHENDSNAEGGQYPQSATEPDISLWRLLRSFAVKDNNQDSEHGHGNGDPGT